MAFDDISRDDYILFGRLFVCGLLKTFQDGRFKNNIVPFWKVDGEFRLRGIAYTDQTEVMRQLAAVGLFEFVNFYGWRLLEPAHAENTCTVLAEPESDIHTDTKVAEVAKPSEPIHESDPTVDVEFGHFCHGCARYPCDKSKAGEPDGDCWDYARG